MKYIPLLLLLCSCVHKDPRPYESTLHIEWQYDLIRQEYKSQAKQAVLAEEFNRTNTDPRMVANVTIHSLFQWNPKTGDRELGYRDDGVVVWRFVPETLTLTNP